MLIIHVACVLSDMMNLLTRTNSSFQISGNFMESKESNKAEKHGSRKCQAEKGCQDPNSWQTGQGAKGI